MGLQALAFCNCNQRKVSEQLKGVALNEKILMFPCGMHKYFFSTVTLEFNNIILLWALSWLGSEGSVNAVKFQLLKRNLG